MKSASKKTAASRVRAPRPSRKTAIRAAGRQSASRPTRAVAAEIPVTETKVKVPQAKGRPMLTWANKRPLREVLAFPAQEMEQFATAKKRALAQVDWTDWPERYPKGGLLFLGDNKEVLVNLIASGFRGQVKFVYIDPPFNTGKDNYVRKVRLHGVSTRALDGEPMSLIEQVQYANAFLPDLYLQLMYERLILLQQVLHRDGVIAVRIDYRYAHHIKLILDEVFGAEFFINEILVARQRETAGSPRKLETTTESIFIYANSNDYFLEKTSIPRSVASIKWTAFLMPGERKPRERTFLGLTLTPPDGQHYPLSQDKVDKLLREHFLRLRCTNCGALHFNGSDQVTFERRMRTQEERFKFYDVTAKTKYFVVERMSKCASCGQTKLVPDYLGAPEESVTSDWTDIPSYSQTTGYPTENSLILLDRLIAIFTRPTDLVLDCFIGSGTTAVSAQRLGRRWIGCDINKGSIQLTSQRVMEVMNEQAANSRPRQETLIEPDDEDPALPAQLQFRTYRVNDYDLAIQHNEAVDLACDRLGVIRTKTDVFFDGTIGKKLVKVIPFDHPASPIDLEGIAQEIRNRPKEERDIVVVCLGKELSCDAWLADYNRRGAPNKITLVELRNDPKYGGFIAHTPASAKVRFDRVPKSLTVTIEDFVSPTVLERLKNQDGLVATKITDWRQMVDSVMVDTDYDGKVFRVSGADVPTRRNDLVEGSYRFEGVARANRIAVKVTDVLGEEVIVVSGA